MILLSARSLSRQFDAEPLFRDVSFDLRPGHRIGLVGPNGAGKTTLLHLLTGEDHSDTGEIETPNAVTVGLLKQRAEFPEGRTLRQEAESGLAHLFELQRRSEELADQMANASASELEKLHKRFDAVQEELLQKDAYNVDHRVDEVLQGLGFEEDDYDREVKTFSGGQQSRILLARLLLQSPEVMLLDEPTNHLDIKTTEWLEGYLATRSEQALILVSHDRYFLDRVCNNIFELGNGRLTEYPGNFTAYWQQRSDRQKVLERTFEKQQEMIARTEEFIRKNKYGQKHAQASDREKKLARVEVVDRIADFDPPPMAFGQATRTGDMVIETDGLGHGFDDDLLFSGLDMRIERGDRLGIVGPNGTGKTTLLRTLVGELTPVQGSVRIGANVNVGYYDQQLQSVDPSETAVEAVRPEHRPEMTPGDLRSMLAKFGVKGELALAKVHSMSGGERSKVALARLASLEANVLILDEPTNHLDLWACEALERALINFGGTILFVSHDRYFLDRVASRVMVLEENGCVQHDGNYTAWLAFRESLSDGVSASPPRAKATPEPVTSPAPDATDRKQETAAPSKRKRKFPYRKVSDIEKEIAEKEEFMERLQADLGDPEIHRDADRFLETQEAWEEVQEELELLYEHWDEATELN